MVPSQILIATLIISLLALVGGQTFSIKEKWLNQALLAAGRFICIAATDLIPEIKHHVSMPTRQVD